MLRYLRSLTTGQLILWCYFLWYLVVLVRYFDDNPRIWLTALGLAAIVGVALYVNATSAAAGRARLGFWPTARFFIIPFCVSSYSALIKNRGYRLGIFSPDPIDLGLAIGACALLCGAWLVAQNTRG